MKLKALTILLYTTCHGSSIFEKTFNLLHREPTSQIFTSREFISNQWMSQKLDHFNEFDTRTWEMRYLSRETYFKEGGPIFLIVGGEWEITIQYLLGGHVHDMAKEHNGYLFYTEHRFYGQSQPTSDLRTENLKYLTVKQALGDLSHFIRTIKASTSGLKSSKVILTGGSYAGTLVTWFKRLYPDLVVGVWASSAPLLAKVDFIEYKEIAGQSIKLVSGEACYDRIQNGIVELQKMFANKKGSEAKVLLNICDNFDENSAVDLWSLFSEISDIFAGIVQEHTGDSIQKACNKVMESDTDLAGLSKFFISFAESSTNCTDMSYGKLRSQLANLTFGDTMNRQWVYQCCNEFGWFHSSGSSLQPFGDRFSVNFYTAACQDIFGDHFTNETVFENVVDTNELFGGLKPEIDNIYFTHGQLDPWRPVGIIEEGKASVIPFYSHCKDFESISLYESKEMTDAKMKIAQLVREWIKDVPESDRKALLTFQGHGKP